MTVSESTSRLYVYRTYPLQVRNDEIKRVLVIIHGSQRDADNYFQHALGAAFFARSLDTTLIATPRFASQSGSCKDTLAADEINWQCAPAAVSWRSGGTAVDRPAISSFAAMDDLLRLLARKETFPNLEAVIVAGHSAGGQFVQRYALTSLLPETLGVLVQFVVANPSSYAYLDASRPTPAALPTEFAAGSPGFTPPRQEGAAAFAPFADATNCTTYDRWPYGLNGRAGYVAKLAPEQLRAQFSARSVTYLLGAWDILPVANFDASCPAAAQGPTRFARGLAYVRHISEEFGAKHARVVVPNCGHNARCIFTSELALPVLFARAR